MDNPSIMSHVSIGVSDLDRSAAFYDAVLAALGARRIVEHPATIAYGRVFSEFWINLPLDHGAPSVGNGTHMAFLARDKEEVLAFWQAALDNGATEDGAPGSRPHYGAAYYGCFVRDPDGHKIEAHAMLEAIDEDGTAAAEAEAHPS